MELSCTGMTLLDRYMRCKSCMVVGTAWAVIEKLASERRT